MKNAKQTIKYLQKAGFRVTHNDGSRMKIFPPDPTKPFYSFHFGEKGLHPLFRFARANWGLDLRNI